MQKHSVLGVLYLTLIRVSIIPSNQPANGTNNLIAYRPSYNDQHRSNLGVLFFNMFWIFPCLRQAHMTDTVHLSCFPTTAEDDGFLNGRAVLQAADIGNSFTIFGSRTLTYALAIQNCTELTVDCLPRLFQIHIACFLPRRHCTWENWNFKVKRMTYMNY